MQLKSYKMNNLSLDDLPVVHQIIITIILMIITIMVMTIIAIIIFVVTRPKPIYICIAGG